MLGLESTISIGKQTSAVNPATLARQALNIYSISGGQTEDDTDDNILGAALNNTADPVLPGPGLDDHKITIKGPICTAQMGFMMAAMFGAETATGSSDYTHEWKSGAGIRYNTIEHLLKTGRYRRHFGCVGESIEIDLDAEQPGYGMYTATFVGLSEAKATTALTGTVTAAPAMVRPAQKLVVGLYNAVSGGDLMGGKISFSRNLKRVRGADGTGIPYAIECGNNSSLTCSLRTRSNDETFWDDSVAKTTRAMAMHLLNSATNGAKLFLDNMRLSRSPVPIEGPGWVEHNFSGKAWQTTAAAALRIQVLNQTATAELP